MKCHKPSDQLKLGPTLLSKYSKNARTAPTFHECDEYKNNPAQQLIVVHRFTKKPKTTLTARLAVPTSLSKFRDDFEELRSLFADAKVELEGEWGFNTEWAPVGWMEPNTWARIKLDALVHEDESSARVIDYKTGKKFGNEIALATVSVVCNRHVLPLPTSRFCADRAVVLRQGEITTKTYTRADAMQFAPGFQTSYRNDYMRRLCTQHLVSKHVAGARSKKPKTISPLSVNGVLVNPSKLLHNSVAPVGEWSTGAFFVSGDRP